MKKKTSKPKKTDIKPNAAKDKDKEENQVSQEQNDFFQESLYLDEILKKDIKIDFDRQSAEWSCGEPEELKVLGFVGDTIVLTNEGSTFAFKMPKSKYLAWIDDYLTRKQKLCNLWGHFCGDCMSILKIESEDPNQIYINYYDEIHEEPQRKDLRTFWIKKIIVDMEHG